MPVNPHKRRCLMPGCRAWAKRGQELCASHLRSGLVRAKARRAQQEGPLALLRAAVEASYRQPPEDLAVIDEELRSLFIARALFLSWLADGEKQEAVERIRPAAFMRAWSESSHRVVQLLRARRDLARGSGELDAIVEDVQQLMLPLESS